MASSMDRPWARSSSIGALSSSLLENSRWVAGSRMLRRDALADGRGDVDLGEHAGSVRSGVQQPLLRLVHRQAPFAVEHLDGFGLLPQQEHPVRTVERGFHLR